MLQNQLSWYTTAVLSYCLVGLRPHPILLSQYLIDSLQLDHELGTPQKVAINIFDEVRKENVSMGSAVFEVDELLGARGNTLRKKLKMGGLLTATVRKSEGAGVLRIKLRAEKLKNTEGMFGISDPFFELCRKARAAEGQTW
jgi:hypothetical protein